MSAPSLLLAAFGPELAGLDRTPPPGWIVATTGVGAVLAAVGTARLLAAHRPGRVLLVGTCGAYDDRLPLGSVFAVGRAFPAADILARRGRAALAAGMPVWVWGTVSLMAPFG
ncbi:MAG TPA: hypothetical protein PLL32_05155, partial [Anaeromyxobacteraceae bacterium]|nr:hypothetical protein [Anaeromyxobacteraceae bacterium]